jgi:outer membrane receptor for ferrienterochelin and colicin
MMGRGESEQMVPSESIAGVQVLTHNFAAEYGRNNGGIISLVSRSGSNEWHGSVYHFLRHEKLGARNTFDSEKPKDRANQFGFTVGGPVVENRSFIFGSYELVRRRRDQNTTVQTLTPEQKAQAAPSVRALADLYPNPTVPGTNLARLSAPAPNDLDTLPGSLRPLDQRPAAHFCSGIRSGDGQCL